MASRHKKIDKTLDLMDDAQIEDVFKRAGLAGASLQVDQKREALKQEHPDDIEPLLKQEAKPAEADLDAMFDDVLAEVTGEQATKAAAEARERAAGLAGQLQAVQEHNAALLAVIKPQAEPLPGLGAKP